MIPRINKSYGRREGRMNDAKRTNFARYWAEFGLSLDSGMINFNEVLGRDVPRIFEIGFGMGDSFLAQAKAHPEQDFIGVEIYRPGVAKVLRGIAEDQLHNIRLYRDDAVIVLEKAIPIHSLDQVQIYFPDPWPKRRHHKRRLIQPAFIEFLATRVKSGGTLHLATDWEDYAWHMLTVMTHAIGWRNLAAPQQFMPQSSRFCQTKFERRGEALGAHIFELVFCYQKD